MKKFFYCRFLPIAFLGMNQIIFAQGVRGKFNNVLEDYVVPAFIIFLIIGVLTGIVRNWDLIEDKNNEGTRVKGFINAGMLVGYVFVAEIIIAAIVGVAASINVSI